MAEGVKGNGHDKAAELPIIKRNAVRLDESVRTSWFVQLSAAQFRERLNGKLWAPKTREFKVYDRITAVCEEGPESEMSELMITDVELGRCELLEVVHRKFPLRKILQGPRIPDGYEPYRDLKGYRIKRVKDGVYMGPYQPKLELAIRDLLDHAALR